MQSVHEPELLTAEELVVVPALPPFPPLPTELTLVDEPLAVTLAPPPPPPSGIRSRSTDAITASVGEASTYSLSAYSLSSQNASRLTSGNVSWTGLLAMVVHSTELLEITMLDRCLIE